MKWNKSNDDNPYIVNDAQITTQFGHESGNFLSRAKHLHTLRVRVITNTERSFDGSREFPRYSIKYIANKFKEKMVTVIQYLIRSLASSNDSE